MKRGVVVGGVLAVFLAVSSAAYGVDFGFDANLTGAQEVVGTPRSCPLSRG
jgi:hypothetical protein